VSKNARLWSVLAANLALVGGLVAVGLAAHSIAVWAEGADYLADAAAVGVSLLAIHLSLRPPTVRHPHGYPRATRYAALVNAGWLLILSLLVAVAAADRLISGVRHVDGLPVLVISGVAALVMLSAALLLGGHRNVDETTEDRGGEEDLNVRAVVLDTAADAAAAAGVAAAGAIIYLVHGVYWLDPAVALVIAVVVGYHAARLSLRIVDALTR
jgi:cobalt-zinc-cadmium efflux system protein